MSKDRSILRQSQNLNDPNQNVNLAAEAFNLHRGPQNIGNSEITPKGFLSVSQLNAKEEAKENRQLIDHAVKLLRPPNQLDMISMDPSSGGDTEMEKMDGDDDSNAGQTPNEVIQPKVKIADLFKQQEKQLQNK